MRDRGRRAMLFITMSVMCAIMRAGGSLARDVASNDARPSEGGVLYSTRAERELDRRFHNHVGMDEVHHDASGNPSMLGHADHAVDLAHLGDANPLSGYFEHPSRRQFVGETASTAWPSRLKGPKDTLGAECAKRCDDIGYGCAGFEMTDESHTNSNRTCTFVGRGYGLIQSVESTFYRKKTNTEDVHFTKYDGRSVPQPDLYAWKGFNGTLTAVKRFCAADSRCAGFYTCASSAHALNESQASKLGCEADMASVHTEIAGLDIFSTGSMFVRRNDFVLLNVMPMPDSLIPNARIVVYSRGQKTCQGAARGAPCKFPFTSRGEVRATTIEFYEPTTHSPGGLKTARPWCETTHSVIAFTDCNGVDSIGARWITGEWGLCSAKCGGGVKARSLACINAVDNKSLPLGSCGITPEITRPCNTHSCNPGCELPPNKEDYKYVLKPLCGAYYEDLRSGFRSKSTQRAACEEYGCCWSPVGAVGNQCYKSSLTYGAIRKPKILKLIRALTEDSLEKNRLKEELAEIRAAPEATTRDYSQPVEPPGCKFGFDKLVLGDDVKPTANITRCDDRCCRGDDVHGKCAYALGYANPAESNPCAKFETGDFQRQKWIRYGPHKFTSCATHIETSAALTSLDCKAKCRLNGKCNAINFNAKASICELMFCNHGEALRNLQKVSGFDVYRWDAAAAYRWVVGEWSDCSSDAKQSSDHETCSMWRTRSVKCVDENGETTESNNCVTLLKGHPVSKQRCFGACGVQNKSCEELNWERTGMCHGPCRGAGADYKTCGAGNIGGKESNGCWTTNDYRAIEDLATIQEAADHCMQAGARLCTREEVAKGVINAAKNWQKELQPVRCQGSWFWTSTPCDDGKGFYVARKGLHEHVHFNQCVKNGTKFLPACCANYKNLPIFEEKYTKEWRNKSGLKLGDYNYCNNERGYCQVGEGHTTVRSHGCVHQSIPAELAGPKYGFSELTGVCIPAYHRNQITFTPHKMFKHVPTDVFFQETGNSILPERAIARLIAGVKPGCVGVDDGTSQILAERRMSRQGAHVSVDISGRALSNEREQTFDSQPFMKWPGLTLVGYIGREEDPFENVYHHMCFCDLSVDCTVNRNWQDLGRLVLDAKLFDYDENPSYYAYKRDNNANYLAVGGEMHETVTLNDLMATFPEFTQRTWGSQPHFQFGELTPTLMSLLTEWCATKCDNNPQCIGFEYVFNWDQTTTYCKLRSHETKMLKTGAYRHDNRHWFWTKTSQRRTDYYWFPSFNHTTEADRMWTNPSSKHGGSGGHAQYSLYGLSSKHAPRNVKVPRMPYAGLEYVRKLMKRKNLAPSHNGDGALHTGDGRILSDLGGWRSGNDPPDHLSARPLDTSEDEDGTSGFFKGGVYMPHERRTCGGTAKGAPCHRQWTQDTQDQDLINPPCHRVQGHDRPVCYTDSRMNYWGYCDCEENGDVKWTRPFGWYSSFHNAAFRQGDATVLTDDLDGVVTHVHCDTPRGSRKPRCEFGLDTTLCLSYQFYAPFIISNHRTGAFKASCPSGTVLTGLALLGNRHDHGRRRDGTQISEDPAGAMPRCGVLSGYRLKQSINGTSHDGTTRVLVANTKFEACPSGTVATGFEYGINRHGNGDPGALQCREYEAVNEVDSDFSRSCGQLQCVGDSSVLEEATSVEECVVSCKKLRIANCTAVEFTKDNKCVLYKGICTSAIHKQPADIGEPFTTPLNGAVFTPVEYEHPVDKDELTHFVSRNVSSQYFRRDGSFEYFATAWNTCDKECGIGTQKRTVYCAASRASSIDQAVDNDNCKNAEELPSVQYCNTFSCDEQCRAETGRRECARFKLDPRRKSHSLMVRREACEEYACCFNTDPNRLSVEFECFEREEDEAPAWTYGPWEECSVKCKDSWRTPDPKKRRQRFCSFHNGTAADRSLCGTDSSNAQLNDPDKFASCNMHALCSKDITDALEQRGDGMCGHGELEKPLLDLKNWRNELKCMCRDGWSRSTSNRLSPCDVKNDCRGGQGVGEWQTGDWGECTPSSNTSNVQAGEQVRSVKCSCYDTCDVSDKPDTWRGCANLSSITMADSLPANFSETSLPHFKADFVLYEFRHLPGLGYDGMQSSLDACVTRCNNGNGGNRCWGVQFTGDPLSGSCESLPLLALQHGTITRSRETHLFIRRGILNSHRQPQLVKLVKDIRNQRYAPWTSALSKAVVDANEIASKRASIVPMSDPIWRWIASVPRGSPGATVQGVPLRKSLYSLSFPLNPNIVKHLRYMRNFLETEVDTSDLADAVLALSYKYRDLDRIVDSTDDGVQRLNAQKTLINRCTISKLLREDRGKKYMRMPSEREENPSPLHALHFLLKKHRAFGQEAQLKDAPWPILAALNVAQFPKGECDWMWQRLKGEPSQSNMSWTKTSGLETKWAHYGIKYIQNRVQCKASNWHPESLPRIAEDGGLCGRLAYQWIGQKSCTGTPSLMVGQPMHAAAISFDSDTEGKKWKMQKFSWIFGSYFTTAHNVLPTDDLAGSSKVQQGSVDHMAAIPEGVNVGLDSFVDVRLAMILFRNVYGSEPQEDVLDTVAGLLLSALEKNPHNIEGWELLFTHFAMRTIKDVRIMNRAYRIFKPHAKGYPKTYEYLLRAIATVYDCKTSNAAYEWLEAEIEALSPGCGNLAQKFAMKSAIKVCYAQRHGYGVDLVKNAFEEELLMVAWGDCDRDQIKNRTNLNVKAGPVDEVAIAFAFELLFGECQGCGATATGLAGDDYSAVLDYLVELEGKFPLASLSSPIPSDCSYGEGNGATLLAGESLAIWKLSGKMIHHKNHVRIEKALNRYAALAGQWNTVGNEVIVANKKKLSEPGPLRRAMRLTGGDKDFEQFKTCTGYVDVDGAPTKAEEPAPYCTRECRKVHQECCSDTENEHRMSSNQHMSCAQACMARQHGATVEECKAAVSVRTCSRTIAGLSQHYCGGCKKCSGDLGFDAGYAGCAISVRPNAILEDAASSHLGVDLSFAPQIAILARALRAQQKATLGAVENDARANATSLISGALSPYSLDQNSTKIDWSMAVDNSNGAGFPISERNTVAHVNDEQTRANSKANSNMNLTFVTSLCDEIRAKAGADTKASDEAATFCSQSAGEPKRLRNGQEAVNTSNRSVPMDTAADGINTVMANPSDVNVSLVDNALKNSNIEPRVRELSGCERTCEARDDEGSGRDVAECNAIQGCWFEENPSSEEAGLCVSAVGTNDCDCFERRTCINLSKNTGSNTSEVAAHTVDLEVESRDSPNEPSTPSSSQEATFPSQEATPSPKPSTPSPRPSTPSPRSSPDSVSPQPRVSAREVRILARTIDRLNSSIASKEAWIESAPRVYHEKGKEEKKQRNVLSVALSTMRRLVRKVRWQERKNARLAARGRPVVDLTQMKEDLQTAESNVSKCRSTWRLARKERKARTTSKIRQAQRNLRDLKSQLRKLEGEYAAATSLTPSAGAHLGSVRDRYAYDRYISLLYAATFIIGVVALAGVGRRMSSDAERVAIARRAVPTYGAVDV